MSDRNYSHDVMSNGSHYVYARKLGSSNTQMMTVDEAQRRGYLVFDYETRTYRPLDTWAPKALRTTPSLTLYTAAQSR